MKVLERIAGSYNQLDAIQVELNNLSTDWTFSLHKPDPDPVIALWKTKNTRKDSATLTLIGSAFHVTSRGQYTASEINEQMDKLNFYSNTEDLISTQELIVKIATLDQSVQGVLAENATAGSEKLNNASIKELAQLQVDLAAMIAQFNDTKKLIQSGYDLIRNHCVPDKMEEEGIGRVYYDGVGNVTTATVTRVSVIAAKKSEFFAWVHANGHEGLIKGTINSSTLVGFVKEQLEEANDVPTDMLNISTFQQARITKN